MRWVWAVVLVAGCRQWFGLDDPHAASDGPAVADDAALVDTPADAPPDALLTACPPSYMIVGPTGARYRHVNSDVDWLDALNDCIDDATNPGVSTHLAVFATDAERAQVNTLLPTTVWIGLSDRVTAGNWIWITKEPAGSYPPTTSPPWTAGEPNGEHCGAMDENGGFESRMCDGTGDVPYLCECDGFGAAPRQY
ncbi:MAG TPA: C-type lectin domain-containing protein [Kofleriaceae bacterium]